MGILTLLTNSNKHNSIRHVGLRAVPDKVGYSHVAVHSLPYFSADHAHTSCGIFYSQLYLGDASNITKALNPSFKHRILVLCFRTTSCILQREKKKKKKLLAADSAVMPLDGPGDALVCTLRWLVCNRCSVYAAQRIESRCHHSSPL